MYGYEEEGEQPDEDYLIRVLARDDGAVWLLSGGLSRTNQQGTDVIVARHVVEIVHQAVETAGDVGRRIGYEGTWSAGVHLGNILGLRSSEMTAYMSIQSAATPFQTDLYVRTVSTTTEELVDRPTRVVERLLKDFARGLNCSSMFPYESGSEIYRMLGDRR